MYAVATALYKLHSYIAYTMCGTSITTHEALHVSAAYSITFKVMPSLYVNFVKCKQIAQVFIQYVSFIPC